MQVAASWDALVNNMTNYNQEKNKIQRISSEIYDVLNRYKNQYDYVDIFEKEIASYIGSKYSVATNSATSAIFLVLKSLNINVNDEILVPAYTFPASINPIIHIGAIPVLVDVELQTANMCVKHLESKINKKTKAILVVHQFGHPANMDAISKIAQKYKLNLIEDAACSFGAEYSGKKCGSFGIAGCFSFNTMKILPAGMGGAIVTDDEDVYQTCRLLSGYGDINKKFECAGYNFRMDQTVALLGLGLIYKVEEIIKSRKSLSTYLLDKLSSINNLQLPLESKGVRHVYQSFPIQIKKGDVNQIRAHLKKKGIQNYFGGNAIHKESYYRKKCSFSDNYNVSEYLSKRLICLSWSPFLSHDYIDAISYSFNEYIYSL